MQTGSVEARPRSRVRVRMGRGRVQATGFVVVRRITGTGAGTSFDLHQAGESESTAPPASLGRLIDGAALGHRGKIVARRITRTVGEASFDLSQAGDVLQIR